MKRYSQKPFPPYRFIPGEMPHPSEDPKGYHYGLKEEKPPALNPALWFQCEPYLFGADLYNQGYWWEAHEAWEGLWKSSTDPTVRQFLQGLIKISAAFLKWHLQQPRGVKRLFKGGIELLKEVREKDKIYMGVDLEVYLTKLEKHFLPVMKPLEQLPNPSRKYPHLVLVKL